MDKQYKPHFIRELKRLMALTLPDFRLTPIPQNHPQRDVFTGALLFASPVSKAKAVWLWWVPGPGVERYFDVFVGWSPNVDTMPLPEKHEPQLYLLRGPHHDFPAAALHLRQIQGESAVCGYTIPTPWDQVSVIKPMAPGREHVAAMERAQSEASALTNAQRTAAVVGTLENVLAALQQVVPDFTAAAQTALHCPQQPGPGGQPPRAG